MEFWTDHCFICRWGYPVGIIRYSATAQYSHNSRDKNIPDPLSGHEGACNASYPHGCQ